MVRAAALMPLALLAGCGDLPQARTESEIREIARSVAREDVARLQSKVSDLEIDVMELRAENVRQAKFISEALGFTADISKQVNNNAKIANENALAEMTARGECGTKPVYTYNEKGELSSIVNQKIPCTRENFKK